MKDSIPSKTDIKELTNFLPLLYDKNIELCKPYPNADMSDIISFKYTGDKEQYNKFKANKTSQGITMEEAFSKYIDQEITISEHGIDENNKTASRHADELKEALMNTDLSKVIVKGSYNIDIHNMDFIQAASHDLGKRVNGAVHSAIASYWICYCRKLFFIL